MGTLQTELIEKGLKQALRQEIDKKNTRKQTNQRTLFSKGN